MELSVRKSDLLRELQLFQGIVERKNTIPILANLLLEADGEDNVHLLATDLEVGLRSRCTASIARAGSVTIPAKKLFEIVRALPETDIRIVQGSKGAIKISADQFDSRMQTLPREDFPTVPEPGWTSAVSLPRDALRMMVAKTQFAITGEDTRFFLNGALFILTPAAMSLIATDGHRLALATAPRGGGEGAALATAPRGGGEGAALATAPRDGGEAAALVTASRDGGEGAALLTVSRDGGEAADGPAEARAILPRKTLWELARLLGDGDADVQYECGENHLFFQVDGRQLISRMIDAQFPAYERVIPTGNDKKIEFDRDRMASAIKRVALLSSERSRAIKFQLSKQTVEVTSSSPDVGEAKEVLAVDYDGDELQICFNAQYVLDFLGVVDTETVELSLKDEVSQAILHPAGGADTYTYVIMPMRV